MRQRRGTHTGELTRVTPTPQEMSTSTHHFFFFFFFLFGQTQDDESQVCRERGRVEDKDGATSTTCLLLRTGMRGGES